MVYLPIFGALLEATGMSLEKNLLKKTRLNYKSYTVYGFLAIVLVMLPFIYFLWSIKPEAFYKKNLFLFFLVVFVSTLANLFTFFSIKREDLSVLEPVRLFQPLFTVVLAVLLYKSEREYTIFALAMIASISLIFPYFKRHHLSFNKYIVSGLLGSFFFALELVISKSILNYYNLFTFYFLRCLFIFLITLVAFRPKIKIKSKTKLIIILIASIWVIYRIILYYGYQIYGIVFTTTLLLLTPVFVFLFAKIFLKEEIQLKHIISSAIIVICVVLAIILE